MNRLLRSLSLALGAVLVTSSLVSAPPAGKGPSGGVDHKALQDGPIQLGTSGGWEYDLANGYCCGGTLGSLIRFSDGSLHVLSNFHVLAADVSNGGNGVVAEFDDPVIHPGLIDIGCNAQQSRPVALLSAAADPLSSTNIDAATAQILDGEVSATGEILEIGQLSNETVAASLGQAVMKSGRTTGFTKSTVAFLDTTISVSYEDECAGTGRGTAEFTGQIVINNSGSKFLAGGDSGSLLVEDKTDRPRAVGLLFAGSSSYAIANPIDEVLTYFGATMVGLDGTGGEGSSGGSGGGKGNGGGKGKKGTSEIARAMAANKKAEALSRRVAKGLGHGVGLDESGAAYVAIFVESLEGGESIPESIDGVSVKLVEMGRIVAF